MNTAKVVALNPTSSRNELPPTPRKIIRDFLDRTGCHEDWRYIVDQWSGVEKYTYNLAKYLTDIIPDINHQQPLFDACVALGMKSWHRAMAKGENPKMAFVKYVRGTLYRLPECLEWMVNIETSDVVSSWDPIENTMSVWWRKKRGRPLATRRDRVHDSSYINLNPADYRLMVLVKHLMPGVMRVGGFSSYMDEMVLRYG